MNGNMNGNMDRLKFKINNRNYTNWELCDYYTLEKKNSKNYNIDPIRMKLFNQDIIDVDIHGNMVSIIHSTVRNTNYIAGVMHFDKILGKSGKKHFKNTKYYFKVVPSDNRLPNFKVPFKLNTSSFSKKIKKIYITFKYIHWNDAHPVGNIINVLGTVDNIQAYYEYQLYSKCIQNTINVFTKKTIHVIKKNGIDNIINDTIINPEYCIEDRTDQHIWNIISIDPKNSRDFDDAFGFRTLNNNTYLLSIYISNVPLWLDSMQLWNAFTNRIATIYLPDRKRPMLPNILSDELCSLQENKIRFAFVLDLYINNNTIIDYNYKNVAIKVKKNYHYNDDELNNDSIYKNTYYYSKMLNIPELEKIMNDVNDSHDLVMYLMILMNYISANELKIIKKGIFRSLKIKLNYDVPDSMPIHIKNVFHGWNNNGSQYVKFDNIYGHNILELDAYTHITSPIRRIVDLINIIIIQRKQNIIPENHDNRKFLFYWMDDNSIDYINRTMHSIRKIQTNCQILHLCTNDPEILNTIYNGYIFEKILRNDGMLQYSVYINELKFITKYITNTDFNKLDSYSFKIYIFKDEESLHKKIMLYEI